jgi:two-component system LytT family response regulator
MKKPTYTLVIIDDASDELFIIKEYISRFPFLSLIAEFNNPEQAVQELPKLAPDLVILDIEMPRLNGFQILNTLSKVPITILCTNHPHYGFEASRADVAGYLSKLESLENFEKTIRRAIARCDHEAQMPLPDLTLQVPSAEKKYCHVLIPIEKIVRIESIHKSTLFVCDDFDRWGRITLDNLELQLPSQLFMRIHRCHIIHLSKIKYYNLSLVALEGSKMKIPIGRSYRGCIKNRLNSSRK